MAELQAQAEASAGFETTTVAAVATGPALFAAADAMLQEQELNDILAPYERDAAILLDILLQDPTALASLKVITSGGNIGGTAQGQTWLSRLRRTLADARCNRGYAGMCDAVLRERVGRSFAMHGAQHAPGGLEEAHNACLLTVLVWAGRHDLAHAIFGSDAGATLARRFEAASAPRGARRAPSGALALLGAEAQDAPQQLMQGGWYDEDWWRADGADLGGSEPALAPLHAPLAAPAHNALLSQGSGGAALEQQQLAQPQQQPNERDASPAPSQPAELFLTTGGAGQPANLKGPNPSLAPDFQPRPAAPGPGPSPGSAARWASQRPEGALRALHVAARRDPDAAAAMMTGETLDACLAVMELELRTISLIPGRREAIASLSPAAAAARAADAASHPACPSHGTVTLLLGHALARGALPDGDCGGPGGSDGAALAAMRLRRERFLDALHRWWLAWWVDADEAAEWEREMQAFMAQAAAAAAGTGAAGAAVAADPSLARRSEREAAAFAEMRAWQRELQARAAPRALLRLAHFHAPGRPLTL
ncbi:hypothetical protein MNEG_6803 [Monoraphidium neglectum]|uniref:Uncharacterized protein n=1 Tax=Monoraphidium neglectum TaxID=145388 RepID=A0A0D2L1G3_9CHLO|nr:hypothetical protein MNEG_6803 [Monoraphidium neglectum]KIZ01159.1 hypothetical protein MNEG_6803 [Monoraphidium neglectum]|eukprot:XP_013900178.1 hypothetical protein MNEG_6803 [Monoraphidium neglectum]